MTLVEKKKICLRVQQNSEIKSRKTFTTKTNKNECKSHENTLPKNLEEFNGKVFKSGVQSKNFHPHWSHWS